MDFPSPTMNYVEKRLYPASSCMTPDNRVIETAEGYALIEPVIKLKQGEVLLSYSEKVAHSSPGFRAGH